MAYVSKEKKAKIAEAVRAVTPKTWKYSLAVRNNSVIVMTIRKAPVDLKAMNNGRFDVNTFCAHQIFEGEVLETIRAIISALNTDNHNNSDTMTDYYDVGHYVDLQLGRWNSPFQLTA